jgi:hypothetical protein
MKSPQNQQATKDGRRKPSALNSYTHTHTHTNIPQPSTPRLLTLTSWRRGREENLEEEGERRKPGRGGGEKKTWRRRGREENLEEEGERRKPGGGGGEKKTWRWRGREENLEVEGGGAGILIVVSCRHLVTPSSPSRQEPLHDTPPRALPPPSPAATSRRRRLAVFEVYPDTSAVPLAVEGERVYRDFFARHEGGRGALGVELHAARERGGS